MNTGENAVEGEVAFSVVSRNGETFKAIAYPENEIQRQLANPVRDGWTFATWKDVDGVELLPENIEAGKIYYADWIDKVPPVLEVVCSKNTAQYQEVVIRAHDIASRIYGYYAGVDNPKEQEVLYTEAADKEFLIDIEEPGKYYFSAKDTAGNVSTESMEFIRIFLAGMDEEVAIKNMIGKKGDKLELPVAKKKGHTFLGWTDSESKHDEPVKEWIFSEEKSLNPVFAPNEYSVSLDADGGSCEVTALKVVYGEEYPKLPEAVRVGYHFIGWSTKKGGEVLAEGMRYEIDGDSTLYAKWEPIHYIVRYFGNGSEAGEMAELECTFDEEFSHPRNNYTKTGYVFKGWSRDSNTVSTQNALTARERIYNGAQWLNEDKVMNLAEQEGAVVDLHAVWQKIEPGVMDYRYCMGKYMYFACTTLQYKTEHTQDAGALFVGMEPAGDGMFYGTDAVWATSYIRAALNDKEKNDMTGIKTTNTTVIYSYSGAMWQYNPTVEAPCTRADMGYGTRIKGEPVANPIATEDFIFIPDLRDCYNYYAGNEWDWFWDINLDGSADTHPVEGLTASGASDSYYNCIGKIMEDWSNKGWNNRYWLRNQYTGWEKYPFYIAQYGSSSCNPIYPVYGNIYGNLATNTEYLVRPMYTMTP